MSLDEVSKTVSALTETLRAQVVELTRERDALRQCFSEASHDAGPAFAAHQELSQLRADLAALREKVGELVTRTEYALSSDEVSGHVRTEFEDQLEFLNKALTAEHTPAEETKPL